MMTSSEMQGKGGAATAKRIWDLPVRLFHWLLVLCISLAAFTGFLLNASWLTLHLVAGISAAVLVLARFVWGFTGSTYSRFQSYELSPKDVLHHLKDIASGRVEAARGHNPLGAWMVVALLSVMVILAVSGTFVWGGALKQGPLKSLLSYTSGVASREVHETVAFIMLALVGLHITGAIAESIRTGENLPRAMVTGNKYQAAADLETRVEPRSALALFVVVPLVAAVLAAAWIASTLPPKGIHVAVPDQGWQRECSACHMAFPPALLPAAAWKLLVAGLADHFGEDASLDNVTAASIESYLVANAAETQDSLPAHQFRAVDAQHPIEITATPFWKRKHGAMPASLFARKSIGAPQNCSACHADAETTSLFAPQNISIPEDKP